MDKNGTQLYISMWHIKKKLDLYVLYGENCNAMACKLTGDITVFYIYQCDFSML